MKLPERYRPWLVRLVAAAVFLNGAFAILRPLAERLPERLESLLAIEDYQYFAYSLGLVLGVTLIYLSLQLLRRKLAAWWLTVAAITLAILVQLGSRGAPGDIWMPLAVLALLLITNDYFRAKSAWGGIRQGALVLMASVLLALAYGTAGFYLMRRHDFGTDFGLYAAFIKAARTYLLLGNPDVTPHTRFASWFLDSLGILGASSLLYGLYSLFRPLDYTFRTLPSERRLAQVLIGRYGRTSEDFFKLWPRDKSYFFTPGREAVIAYQVRHGVAMCAGDPVGSPEAVREIIPAFGDFCLTNGWMPSFLYVSDDLLSVYARAGLQKLKVGEDAVVDLARFAADTSRNKHFRNIANRFRKKSFTLNRYRPPHDGNLLQEMGAISRAWTDQSDRREWGFLAGSYSPSYLQLGDLAVVRDEHDRAQAFVNLLPTVAGQASVDLMRYRPDAPANIMDFLFLELLLELEPQGGRTFNLGLAPLSGLDPADSSPEERLLNLLYHSNQPFVSLKGLRQFKAKFEPDWQARYAVYEGPVARLARISLALAQAMVK